MKTLVLKRPSTSSCVPSNKSNISNKYQEEYSRSNTNPVVTNILISEQGLKVFHDSLRLMKVNSRYVYFNLAPREVR